MPFGWSGATCPLTVRTLSRYSTGIARQSDDALDVVHFRLDGIVEHDDVAALDLSGRNQDVVDDRGF